MSRNILAIPQALTRASSAGQGTVLAAGGQLGNPLGLTLAPHGDLLEAGHPGPAALMSAGGPGDLMGSCLLLNDLN
jgi:hypothetical protein